MSHTSVNFIVVNGSSKGINGTACHYSGGQAPTELEVDHVPPFHTSNTKGTTTRSNHDDHWSWKPNRGAETKVQLNVHSSGKVVLIVTDTLLVAVTSEREKVKKKELVRNKEQVSV